MGNEVLKEGVHYTCRVCINISSIMKIEKKSYPQVYLEEYKYTVKKKKMPEFVDVELELNCSFESE